MNKLIKFSVIAIPVALVATSPYKIMKDYPKNKFVSQNIEAITTEETSLKEYQVIHFPCVDEYGRDNGTYVAKCFKGGQSSYHSHNCSTCKGITR